MTRADLGVKGAGIGKTRGAGPMNRKATIPALAALRRWWPGSHQWPGSRRMAAVPGTAAGVRASSPRRRDRSAMTARNGVAPHRRLARAAWVLLALAGLAPAPAQAQVEDYISNVISTGSGNSNTEITISQSFAQTFRTGSQSGGYPLQEVVLRLDGLDTGTGAIRVTIRENSVVDGNNVPGMTRYTLTNPASLSSSNSGRNTFTAPSGATLVANTLYHVVAESTSGTAARWQRTTRRTMSVRPFGTDWDIGFDYLRQRADPPSWEVAASGRAFMVAVRGGDDGGGGNAAPTGVPTISDTTPMVGDTLTADASGISDPDGPASLTFTWRWLRVSGSTETPISGATSPTYTVVAADVGAKLKVEASFTDASGTAETVESAETDTVGEAPLPTVSVERVSSLVEEGAGAQFTVTRTVVTTGALTVRYDVSESGAMVASGEEGAKTLDFSGNTTSLTVTVPTVEDSVHEADSTVTVTLTADAAYDLGADTTATVTVEDDDNADPTGTVTIDNTSPMVGDTLTADASTVSDPDGPASLTFAWRWLRVSGSTETPISSATSASYTVTDADAGAKLKVEASFTDEDGTAETVESVPTMTVPTPPPPPDILVGNTGKTDNSLRDNQFFKAQSFTTGDAPGGYDLSSVVLEIANPRGRIQVTIRESKADGAPGDIVHDLGRSPSDEGGSLYEWQAPAGAMLEAGTDYHVVARDFSQPGQFRWWETTAEDGTDAGAASGWSIGGRRTSTGGTAWVDRDGSYQFQIRGTETRTNTPATGEPTIDNAAPRVGDVLTADGSGISDADGPASPTFTWQWIRVSGGTDTRIAGATSASYTVVAADLGATLKVEATFTDDGGTEETVESAETAAVGEALPTVTVTPVTTPVTEGSDAVFRLARTGDTAARLRLRLSISETGDMVQDSREGEDLPASIPAGGASTNLFVPTVDDGDHETDSVVTVTLAANAAYELGTDTTADVTVEDNDNAAPTGTVTIDDTTPMVGETLTADASGVSDPDGPASPTFTWRWLRVSGGTDTPIPGATSATYTVVAADAGAKLKAEAAFTDDDGTAETVESAETDPVGGAPLPALSIGDESAAEGDSGSKTLEFTVTLDSAATATVTVEWATSDGTATAGTDYTTGSGTLTINTGDSSGTVSVTVLGDEVDEPDETFTVTLTNPTGATLGDATAMGTITNDDDDPTVTLVLTPDTITEAGGTSTVTATLNHPSSEATTVTVSASPVSPAVAGDYTLSGNLDLTIAAGATTSTGTVTITAVDNDVVAAAKEVTVSATATNSQGITAPQNVALTITDDEEVSLPTVSVAPVASPVVESEDAQFTVTRTGVTTGALTVRYNVVETGAMVRSGDKGAQTVSFSGDTASVTVTVPTVFDNIHERNSRVTVTLTADAAYELGTDATARVLVKDDDDSPATGTVTVTGTAREGETLTADTSGIADEDGGLDTAAYVYQWVRTPSGGGDEDISGATSETYVPVSADAGATLKVRVTVTDDEGHEATFTSAPTSAVAALPALSIGDASVDEGDTGSATLDFTVTLDSAATETVTVEWATSDGTATAGTDYTAGDGTVTFNAGDSSKTVSVTVAGDNVDEPNETFTVTLSNPSGATIGDGAATGTITDDDATPKVTLALSSSSITEVNQQSTVTATLDHPSSEETTVTVSVSPVSPAVAGDYRLSTNRELTIAAGSTTSTGTVTVTSVNNTVDAPDKTVTVSGTATNSQGVTAPDAVTLTIRDNDATPTVTLVLTPDSITEVNEQSTVTATLDHPSSEATTVTVSVSPVSPAVAGDYTLSTNRELTIAAGATTSTGTVTVTSVNNTVDAPHKTVTVSGTATNSQGVTAPDAVTLTIRDNDATPTVTLVLTPASITESGGTSTVTATLNHPSSDATTVTVSASPVSPAVAGDYTLSGNLDLTIAAGQTTSTGTVTITGVDNDVVAAAKEVTVSGTATNGQGVTAPGDVTLTIRDDDEPGLSVADASVAEGDSGSTTMTFTVTLNPVAVSPVTVDWATSDGTARAGTDYTAGNGSLTFNVGDSTKTVSVTVTGDNVDEPDETFTVTLSSASGAAISDGTATGTIRDDDDPPTVTLVLSPDSITEVNAQSTVTATLDHPSSEETTVTVSVSPDSPAVAGDYRLSSNRELTIAAGATTSTGTVTVTSVNNTVDAPHKTVTVSGTATNSQGVTAPNDVTLTIRDNDATPTVTLVLTPASIMESGGTSTVTARLNHPSSEATTVTVSAAPVSPAVSGDYTLSGNLDLTIAAGATTSTGTVTVTGVDNTADAPDKAVTVSGTATNGQGVTAPAPVALTIEDDDGPPKVTLVLSPASITEVNEQSTVTATLDRASSADTTVTVSVSPDSPAVAGDYTLSTNRVLTIAAGATTSTGTVTVTSVNNAVDAPDKTVTVSGTASNGQGVTAPDAVTLTIRDNDATPTVTLVLSPASITEVNQESTVTATLDHPSSEETTVTVSVSPDSPAVAGDYTLSGSELTIAAGSTTSTGTVTVTSVNNTVDAPHKTVTVSGTATNSQGVTAPDDVTLTIRDNDATPAVTLVLTPASITEDGGTSTVTARLNHPSSEATTVTVSASPVSPAVAGDYTLSGNLDLTIAAGATTSTGTVTITAVDNDVMAADKEVTVSGTAMNAQGITVPDDVTLTIRDDDVPGLSIADESVAEGDSGSTTMMFTVMLNPVAVSQVTVDWTTADGTARAGTDYTAGNGSLTFNAGDSGKTVSVTVTGDDVDEPDETFTVTLSSASGATIRDGTATGTIRDDDAEPKVTLVLTPSSITEVDEQSTVTATLDRPSSEATTVTVSVAPVSPAVAGDYRLSANRVLTIAAGATTSTGTVTVTSVNNTVDAPHRTVTVSGTATNSQGVTAPAPVTLTLRDNDATPTVTLVLTPASIDEDGGTSTVTATLDHPSSEATTVTVSAAPVDPAVPGDYTLSVNRVLTIAAGATTSTGTVTITAVDNDADAADREVTVSGAATNSQGVTAPDAVTLTITNDDKARIELSVSLAEGTTSMGTGETPEEVEVSEGDRETTVTVTATVTGDTPLGEDRTVMVSVTSGQDGAVGFAKVEDFPIVVPAGPPGTSASSSFVLAPENDEVAEADAILLVSGRVVDEDGVPVADDVDVPVTPAMLTLTDNDEAPTDIELSVADVVVREDAGEAVFTLRLSRPSERAVEVVATFMDDGTATSGEDYLEPNEEQRRVEFAKGETEQELKVVLLDDEDREKNETFEAMFESGEGSTERLEATATCTIVDDEVADAREHRLEYALASFGRTVVQDLVTAVEDRRWATSAGTTATLAGTRLPLSEEAVYEALQRYVGPDGDLVVGTDALRELLSRSSFQLSLGGEGEAGGPGADSLVLWGRGSQSWSAGRLDPEVGTEGEVLSGQLGMEFRPREDTLLGVMLNGSAGEQEFDGALGTEVETEVLGVHPYAQWSPREGLRTWAMLGYGAGEATLTDEYSALAGTDLEMMMAAGGGSHEVASLWGIDWSLGTNGFFVQLDADEVRLDADGQAALVPAVKSEVWQVRLLLEGSAGEDFGGVSGLRGNVELAARVDGGDAESGMGMEVGGGVAYGRADLGLEVEASGRVLLSHEEEGLEDAGVSLALEFDPGAPGRGVYFALTPSWGNAASGARSMWEDRQPTVGGSGGRDRFDPQMRLSSELGYAAPTPTRRGTLTTYGAFSSDGGASRQYRVGRRLELGVLSMSLEARASRERRCNARARGLAERQPPFLSARGDGHGPSIRITDPEGNAAPDFAWPRPVRVLLRLPTTTRITRLSNPRRVPCRPGGDLNARCQRS